MVQLRLIGACVADTLHHVLAGCVEDILVGHIAHGLAVDLHSQRIGLVDDIFKHCMLPSASAQTGRMYIAIRGSSRRLRRTPLAR